jgi:glucose-6-phosphate-specific signal transduction histidine kinase
MPELLTIAEASVMLRLKPSTLRSWLLHRVGIFLLLAVRDPVANRSLIAFGGWANLPHAAVMAAQEYRNVIERQELVGVVVFAIVGVVLVALAPAKQPVERPSAEVA